MKKILSILVVFTVLVSGVKANDTEKPTSEAGLAVMKSKTGFKVLYKGAKKSDIKITIYNAQGQTIHKERLRNTDNFARPYNLTGMSEGDYTVEVRDGDGSRVKKINYSNKKPQLLAKLTAIPGETSKYVLTVGKMSGVSNVSVRIYDERGEIVYDVIETVAKDFAKVYDMSKVSSKFSVQLSANNGAARVLTN
jgi:hypothetical protein